MFTYEKLEKLIGIRKNSDFSNPRVASSVEVEMPINSAILWYHREYIDNPLFQKLKRKPKVFIQMKYFKEKPGKFRRLNIDTAAMVQKVKKLDESKTFDFVTSKSKLFLTDRNATLLFDFYRLEYLHKYEKYRGSEYDKHMNAIRTLVSASIEPDRATSRTLYIPIPIPKHIPTLQEIKLALQYDNYKTLDVVKDKDMLIILELIKLLGVKSKSESIFKRIKKIEESDVKFIFGLNGKVTMCSIINLYALYKENEVISKVKGVGGDEALRTFIKYLIVTTIKTAKSLDTLDKDTSTDVSLTGNGDEDIDTLIEDHNNRNNVEDPISEEEKLKNVKPLKEILTESNNVVSQGKDYIKEKFDNGEITKGHYDKVIEALKIAEKRDKENEISDEDAKLEIESIPDDIIFKDKEMLKDTNSKFTKSYLEKAYKKQQEQVFNHFASVGLPMIHHEIEEKRDIAYAEDKHIITMLNNKGREIKIPIIIPAIDEDGKFKINNNEMVMIKQKADLPIKKISFKEVALNSYYSKVFISKASNSREDIINKIHKELSSRARGGDKDVGLIILGRCNVANVELPHIYQIFSRKIKMVQYKRVNFNFDYSTRLTKFKDVDEKHGVVVGKRGKDTYYINNENELIKVGDKVENLGLFVEYLNLDIEKLPIEYANMQIMGTNIPLILILSFYDGLENVLHSLDVKYTKVDSKQRTPYEKGKYVVRFKEYKLIIKSGWYDVVVGGLLGIKDLKYYDFLSLNSTTGINDIITNMGINSRRLSIELKLMKRLWVDPMTLVLLKQIKEPTTFVGLLYRSAEMLKDDFHKKQNDVSGLVIKGYDRLNGMLYHVMVKAIRDNEQKSGMVKSKLTVNPYELKAMLAEDGTFTLVDDLNPFTRMKQDEDVTLIGKFGRNKASIAARDRIFDSSSMGYVSEATKDSGQVGVTTYLPATSKMDNMYGLMEEQDDLEISNIVSSSAMMHPGSDTDDNKRMLYISVQNGSVVPTNSQRVWPIGTSYEYVIPYRMDKKFVAYAKEDGKVLSVSQKAIVIQYKSGKKTYKMLSWTTKEIGGMAYKHNLITNLSKGDTIKPYDIIYYDDAFFGVDIFDDKRIVYKGGDVVLVAFNENQETYEDSATIDRDFANKFSTNLTSVVSFTIPTTSKLKEVREVGDNVKYNDTMVNFVNSNGFDDGELNSDRAKEFLDSIDTNALRAESKGHLFKVEVFYRAELKDMSPSIRKFVEKIDKDMVERTGYTGKVDHTYSIKARPLDEDQLEIKFYMEKTVGIGVGDKAILANQLKMTFGEVADKITGENGERIDLTTSDRSVGARIVNSPQDVGSASTVLVVGTKEALRLAKI